MPQKPAVLHPLAIVAVAKNRWNPQLRLQTKQFWHCCHLSPSYHFFFFKEWTAFCVCPKLYGVFWYTNLRLILDFCSYFYMAIFCNDNYFQECTVIGAIHTLTMAQPVVVNDALRYPFGEQEIKPTTLWPDQILCCWQTYFERMKRFLVQSRPGCVSGISKPG